MMGMRKLSMHLRKGAAAVFLGTALFSCPAYCAATDFEQLRIQNGGHLADSQRYLPTTEKAVILTFGGLSKKVPLQNILKIGRAHV